jgi:uncharacterized protein YdaU (DUF1376 family)
MAKDPAFLFYPSDFLTGTMFMNNEQIGIYIRLLCSQHQHGGVIDKISFNSLVGNNEIIRSKFIEIDLGFYNQRLANEMEKRNKKSNNISNAVKEVWEKRKKSNAIPSENNAILKESKKKGKRILMGIVNENVNINEIENYFIENGFSKELANKFYLHYQPDWIDSNGKKVKDWKKKAQTVWFKPENNVEKKFKCEDMNVNGFFYPYLTQSEFDEQIKTHKYLRKL